MKETIDDISLLDFIDSGCFSETFKSKKRGYDKLLATKKIDLGFVNKNPYIKEYIENEIVILNEIKHPNIVKLYDVKRTKDYLYLIMEYCNGGSLFKVLTDYIDKNEKPFNEEIVRFLMKQILAGVECIHKHKVIHCDLKLDNILLKYNSEDEAKSGNIFLSRVKIIDFNISLRLKKSCSDKYMKESDIKYDEKNDIMALGVLCYEMLYGKKPFEFGNGNKDIENSYKIKNKPHISEEAKSFIISMVHKDKKKRANIKDLLNHDFLKNNVKEKENTNVLANKVELPISIKNSSTSAKNVDIFLKNTDVLANKVEPSISSKNTNVLVNKVELPISLYKTPLKAKKNTYVEFKSADKIKNKNQLRPIFKKYSIGHGIESYQYDIIISCCKKYYMLIKGGCKAAKNLSEEIKSKLGDNWLVMISDLNCGQFDFSISPAKKGDFIVFSLDKKLFQVCRY